MSARDVIARACAHPAMFVAAQYEHETVDQWRARAVEHALAHAGFPIVHKDEIHAPTVERCAETVEKRNYPCVGDARRIAAALRELMKEVG